MKSSTWIIEHVLQLPVFFFFFSFSCWMRKYSLFYKELYGLTYQDLNVCMKMNKE